MSNNIFKPFSIKKNASELFSIFKKNISKDNSDKSKSVIKDEVGRNDILILQKFI